MRVLIFSSSEGYSGGVRQAEYQHLALLEKGIESYFFIPKNSQLAGQYIALPENEKDWQQFLAKYLLPKETILHSFHNRAFVGSF